MPILTDPRAKIEYILKSDRDRPANDQGVFIFKILTAALWKKVAAHSDAFDKSQTGAETLDCAIAVIKEVLVGWRNLKLDFDLNKIEELLTPAEITELMQASIAQQIITVEDKKKLDSPSPSDTGSSVKIVQE